MLKITEWADDVAHAKAKYRDHEIEFSFKPGAYTGKLADGTALFATVVAECVTEWNIECDLTVEELEKLPLGALRAVYLKVVTLSTMAELPEVSAT